MFGGHKGGTERERERVGENRVQRVLDVREGCKIDVFL